MAKQKPARPHIDPATGEPDPVTPQGTAAPDLNTEIAEDLKSRSQAATRTREQRMTDWKRNVETRLGHSSATAYTAVMGDSDAQNEINPDWALTKTKTANLFSQVPVVRGTHENKQYAPAVSPFLKQLNYEISDKRANAAASMEECLNDVVNASGIAAAKVGWAVRTVDVPMANEEQFQSPNNGPQSTRNLTPDQLQQLAAAKLITLKAVTTPVDSKSYITRLSPGELLVPDEFTGSNFDDGDWIGYDGKMTWAEAIVSLQPKTDDGGPGLQPADKDLITAGDEEGGKENLRANLTKTGRMLAKKVHFTELFYWRYRFDPEETSFHAIWRMVFIKGKVEPIIHEPWAGQEQLTDPQSGKPIHKYVGAMRYPIQVLTVTYISDNPVPPSDTQAGRPQVMDLRRSRLQIFQNRERSTPIRWFDVNRVDLLIQNQLMRGTYQGFIPTNGDGSRSVGEIARASYPSEDLAFDNATKQDLMDLWQIGNTQMGLAEQGRRNVAQVNAQQQGFATRIGQERNRVAQFFLRICEVLSGLMILYSDFPVLTPQEKQQMVGAWDAKQVLADLVFSILPDSTVVLDSNAKIAKLAQFLNLTAKSGFVNPMSIIAEMAELSGLDPAEVVVQPQPKPPDPPNLSLRLSGKQDLMNPMALAMYFNPGKQITAQDLEAAKQLLLVAAQPPQPAQAPPPMSAAPGGAPPAPQLPGAGGPPPDAQGGPPPGPPAQQHEDWTLNDKVMKRSRDSEAGA